MISAREGGATIAPLAMPGTSPAPTPSASFRFCPRCGRGPADRPDAQAFTCPACGFHYHFNPVVAAGVLATGEGGRVLFIRRAKEPAQGLLAFPGGFVDFGETAEEAAAREAHEETGIRVEGLRFLGSWPNLYEWRGITYAVVDLYFSGRVADGDAPSARHEVEEIVWLRPEEVDPGDLAFPTTRAALARFREVLDVVT
jgi:ADP-ribose pyrophosphatase YjhB (NUDIX family)